MIARSRYCGEGHGVIMATRTHSVQALLIAVAYTLWALIPGPAVPSPAIVWVCAAIAGTALVLPLALFVVSCVSASADWWPSDVVELCIAITRGCFAALAIVLFLSSLL